MIISAEKSFRFDHLDFTIISVSKELFLTFPEKKIPDSLMWNLNF